MHLEVSFKNLKPREEVRRRAQALFAKLERFLDPASDAKLVLTAEHGRCVAELTVVALGEIHQLQEEDEEIKPAIDRAFHRIETTLRRAKEKRVDRWHRGVGKADGFAMDEVDLSEDETVRVAVPPLA
jgi:ribosomal subunit interface protein